MQRALAKLEEEKVVEAEEKEDRGEGDKWRLYRGAMCIRKTGREKSAWRACARCICATSCRSRTSSLSRHGTGMSPKKPGRVSHLRVEISGLYAPYEIYLINREPTSRPRTSRDLRKYNRDARYFSASKTHYIVRAPFFLPYCS